MNKFLTLLRKVDKSLLIFTICFAIISLLILSSNLNNEGGIAAPAFRTQCIAFVLGYILIGIFMHMDLRDFKAFERLLYILSLLLLLAVYIPHVGIRDYNSLAWINLGFMRLQPSEIVKLSYIILFSIYLERHQEDIRTVKGIFFSLLYSAPFILIVLKEDLGSALVYCSIWLLMIFFTGIRYKHLGIFVLGVVAMIPLTFPFLGGYQKDRIFGFLNPEDMSIQSNYQVLHSKISIGSGGFIGKGLFQGTQKNLGFLPVRESDFVFAVLIEELGAIAGIILIALYGFFLYRIAAIGRKANDLFSALVCVGIIGMFGFQIFENIAMTMGIMPVTGITLPFISYGGSSILASMAAVGIVNSIYINNAHR